MSGLRCVPYLGETVRPIEIVDTVQTVPTPPSIMIKTCRKETDTAPLEPLRSTFCFVAPKYLSKKDIMDRKRQWDTFETVENRNSIILNQLANTVPVENTNTETSSDFYQFVSSDEKRDYNLGHLAHTVAYPDISDFIVPYSARPIPYTSSVLNTIAKTTYNTQSSSPSFCTNYLAAVPVKDYDTIMNDRKGLLLYIRVSTQVSEFPNSPYKFESNKELITYNKYKNIFLCT